jgi:hypothetical protein
MMMNRDPSLSCPNNWTEWDKAQESESAPILGHTLATNLPVKMGGKDSAPHSGETLLAAWMGYSQATALFVG